MRASVATILVCLTAVVSSAQSKRLDDNSDWWSIVKDDAYPAAAKSLKRRPPDSTFHVAGIELGANDEEGRISRKFGHALQIDRGDASTGRHQLCYSSSSSHTHLIFEWGEVDSVAYLFTTGKKWIGEDDCLVAPKMSANLKTGNGLAIGVSREQVRRVLGNPSLSSPNRLYYSFAYKQKTTPAGLRQLRKDNANMSEDEFRKNFSTMDVVAVVDARFGGEKLTYLAISRSETY